MSDERPPNEFETWVGAPIPTAICTQDDANAFSKSAFRSMLGALYPRYENKVIDFRSRSSKLGLSGLGSGLTIQYRPVLNAAKEVVRIRMTFTATIGNAVRNYTVVVDNGAKWKVVIASLARLTCTDEQALKELKDVFPATAAP